MPPSRHPATTELAGSATDQDGRPDYRIRALAKALQATCGKVSVLLGSDGVD